MLSSVYYQCYVMPSWKQNALGSNSRNISMSLRDSLLGFYNFIYYIHLFRICILVLIGKLLHMHMNNSLGKKSESIFTNRSVICNQSCNMYIQQIGKSKIL